MAVKHPYCRTCGSRIHSSSVCQHCGCEPLKGNNYCCDCGTYTMAQAIMCVECGASFQRKFPAILAILISCALVVTLGGAAYFIYQYNSDASEKIAENVSTEKIAEAKDSDKNPLTGSKGSAVTIINNIPPRLLRKKNDAILKLTKNILPQNLFPEKPAPKPVVPEKIKEEPKVILPVEKNEVPSGRMSMNAFSSREMRSYSVGCSYYEGRSKNNVVFFTTNVYGYAKINGKTYALQGVQKTNDIARFAGAGYEVTIEIEGLAGNENEWVAAGTMTVKDVRQRTLAKHKIYSSCTDF